MAFSNILVVRFSSLGDVILTTPLIRAIAEQHPEAAVTFVTRDSYAPLLRTNPYIKEVIGWPRNRPSAELARELRGRKFDAAVDLQGSLRSLYLRLLVPAPWRSYSKGRLVRWARIWSGWSPKRPRLVAHRYFDAAGDLGVKPDSYRPEVYPTVEDEKVAARLVPRGCIALAPGASRASKRWPVAYWRSLADRLLARGEVVVALGTQEERPLLCGGGVIEAYGLPLLNAAAVLQRAKVAVTNDSGAMHLAAAVGVPVVALFGPTAAAEFLPPRSRLKVLERFLPCRPCSSFGSTHCPLGHQRCMVEIVPAEVEAALEGFA